MKSMQTVLKQVIIEASKAVKMTCLYNASIGDASGPQSIHVHGHLTSPGAGSVRVSSSSEECGMS